MLIRWALCVLSLLVLHAAASWKLYDVLGVAKTATARDIRRAYRKLALKHHPDKASNEAQAKEMEGKFVELASAYEVLGDESKRKQYDAEGDGGETGRQKYHSYAEAYAAHGGVVEDTAGNWFIFWLLLAMLVGPAVASGWKQLAARQAKATAVREREEKKVAERTRQAEARAAEIRARKEDAAVKRERAAERAKADKARRHRAEEERADLEAAAAARVAAEEEVRAERRGDDGRAAVSTVAFDSGGSGGGLWSADELTRLSKAMTRFPPGTVRRWECVASAVGGGRSAAEAATVVRRLKQRMVGPQAVQSVGESATEGETSTEGEGNGVIVSGEGDFWTNSEQRALEKALRDAGEEGLKGGDKWRFVAERVPSRGIDECRRRFALVRKQLRRRKQ